MKVFLLVATLVCTHAVAFDGSHAGWDAWLKRYVVRRGPVSGVRYAAAKASPAELEGYLATLSAVTAAQFEKFSRPEKIAFLINAYNAFTVKLIVDYFPVKGIKDIGGWFSSPWKMKFLRLLGEETSLDAIEHGRLRKEFDEPRVHFALVCASKGCPALWDEAYVGARLEAQLDRATKAFLSDSSRNQFLSAKKTFEVSKIFDWFAKDFEKPNRTVQEFLAVHMAKSPGEAAAMREAVVKFMEYDWTLNLASEASGSGSGS